MNSLDRITIDVNICHGKPTVRRSRMMVETILEYLAGGSSIEEMITEFPDLEEEDILACIAYASKVMHFKNESIALV